MATIEATASKAWLHEQMGAVFDKGYYFDPDRRFEVDRACDAYLRETLPELGLVCGESNLTRPAYADEARVLIGGIQPNMLLGMLLGAEFIPQDGMDADISPALWANRPVEELPAPENLLDHEWVKRFEDQLADQRQRADRVAVAPFFWDVSGRAAVHGLLTTAQKLRGEAIFLEMMTDPETAENLILWIGKAYGLLVRHFANLNETKIECVHVGECSACMVSPDLLGAGIVPALGMLGRELGGIRLHSCGASTHLLDAFAKIEGLKSLDLGGETSMAAVRKTFAPDFPVSIAPLVPDLRNSDPAPLLAWAERVIEENAGGPLTFTYHLEPGYQLNVLRAFAGRVLQKESA